VSAEEGRAEGAIEEPGPYNVANTAFDDIIIIPLIALKDSLEQTFGKLNPTPTRGGFEHSSVGVPRSVIFDVTIRIETQTCQTHPFDISCLLVQEKGPHAEGANGLSY
jgi:hypothetical protein